MTLTDGTPYDRRTQAEIDADTQRALAWFAELLKTGWRRVLPWVLIGALVVEHIGGGPHFGDLLAATILVYAIRGIEKRFDRDA